MNALLASAFSFCASSLSCSVTSFASDILRVASAGDGAEDGGVEPDGPGEDGAELDGLLLMIVIFVKSLQTGWISRTTSGTMAEGCRVQETSKPELLVLEILVTRLLRQNGRHTAVGHIAPDWISKRILKLTD